MAQEPDHESLLLSGRNTATGTADTELIAAQGVGVRVYVTSIIVSNNSSTNSEVDIKDGSTIKVTIPAPSNGGAVLDISKAPLKLSANTALNFAAVTGVTTMKVSVLGYRGA